MFVLGAKKNYNLLLNLFFVIASYVELPSVAEKPVEFRCDVYRKGSIRDPLPVNSRQEVDRNLQNVRVNECVKTKKLCASETKYCATLAVILVKLAVTSINCYIFKMINLYCTADCGV